MWHLETMDEFAVICWRLGLAALAGFVIGWDRQVAGKPAGLRTHMLISLGAAFFAMSAGVGDDLDARSRAIQGVATGVGFLGAGEIVHRGTGVSEGKPRNLTSAAAVWVCAGLGVAAATGQWKLALVGILLSWLTLKLLKLVEKRHARHTGEPTDA